MNAEGVLAFSRRTCCSDIAQVVRHGWVIDQRVSHHFDGAPAEIDAIRRSGMIKGE
jgi:hypothetical protein